MFWPEPKPLNYSRPAHVPARLQGSVPVICRLVWSTQELLPARAIRWTDDRVMVAVTAPEARSQDHELLVWLRPQDVYRTIPPRRRPTPPATVA